MLACIPYRGGDVSTPSGWTAELVDTSDDYAVYTKIADATDVAASNFTFTKATGTNDRMAGVLYAFSGAAGLTFVSTDVDADTDGYSAGALSFVKALTPVSGNSHVIQFIKELNTDGVAQSYSTYTLTGGSTSWTERLDANNNFTGASYVSTAIADSAYTGTTQITAAGMTIAENGASGTSPLEHILILVEGAQNATGTTALLTTTPVFFANAGSAGTSGTTALLETTPTVQDASGSVDNFSWTNESGTTTTWTNES